MTTEPVLTQPAFPLIRSGIVNCPLPLTIAVVCSCISENQNIRQIPYMSSPKPTFRRRRRVHLSLKSNLKAVPDDYPTVLTSSSTIPGYSASRILIEQFAQLLQKIAPELWNLYLKLGPTGREMNGILPIELLL